MLEIKMWLIKTSSIPDLLPKDVLKYENNTPANVTMLMLHNKERTRLISDDMFLRAKRLLKALSQQAMVAYLPSPPPPIAICLVSKETEPPLTCFVKYGGHQEIEENRQKVPSWQTRYHCLVWTVLRK